jgi:N-acetylglucosaminyldiphosphoundecaprenol N-acetyl-beta-D-mannosaminyltransferase
MRGGRPFQVSTINLDFVVRAPRDPDIRRIFQRSDLNLADGAPVVWLARLLGAEMPARVAGADLVPALMSDPALSGSRVFLLGGEDGVANLAAKRFLELYPGIEIAGTYEPRRASVEDMDNAEILRRIEAAKPDVLLVAFGNPKQERWIDVHRDRLPVSVAIGVGCVFDLVAGKTSRAPRWMQDAGLEWLYRLSREPRRLAGRYARDAMWLIPITARALRQRVGARGLAGAA